MAWYELVMQPTRHLYFLVNRENTSDKNDVPEYTTRKRCITSINATTCKSQVEYKWDKTGPYAPQHSVNCFRRNTPVFMYRQFSNFQLKHILQVTTV